MRENRAHIRTSEKIASKPLDPIGSILNHILAVLIIAGSVSILAVVGIQLKVKPSYQSLALIKVEPVIPKILYGKEEASITPYYDDFVNTEINIIKSYSVLARAIEIYHKKGFIWQFPDETIQQSVGRLMARLSVQHNRGSQLISISMYSRRKDGLADIINSAVEGYLEANQRANLNKDAYRLEFLKERREQKERELSLKYALLQELSTKYAVDITDEKNIYVYLQSVTNLIEQLTKIKTRRIEAEARLLEMKNQLNDLTDLDLSADVIQWVESDSALKDNRIQLSRKLQDMGIDMAGLKESNPEWKDYQNEVNRLNEMEDILEDKARKVGEKVLRGKLISDHRKEILLMETDYISALNTEKKLEKAKEEAERKATEVGTHMMRASTLRKDIQRLQDSLFRIDERIDQIEVESRSSGRIVLREKARTPEEPESGKKIKLMMIAIIGSFGMGAVYAIGKDKMDFRLHTPEDVERVLGFPPTGYILEFDKDPNFGQDIFRISIDSPISHIAEQYKNIAFSIAADHEKHHSKIFSCLSESEQQGVSSFLINLLSSIKEVKHKKIYVDLNIWNPISPMLVPDRHYGLWEMIEGKYDLKEVIVTDADYPFHILPFGNWVLSEKSVFQEIGLDVILDILRLEYEYIMVDSPPLFLTTDSKFLAELADAVILVVKAEKITERELFRAVKTLDMIGVEGLSVVLNQAKFIKGKYFEDMMNKYYQLVDGQKDKKA